MVIMIQSVHAAAPWRAPYVVTTRQAHNAPDREQSDPFLDYHAACAEAFARAADLAIDGPVDIRHAVSRIVFTVTARGFGR